MTAGQTTALMPLSEREWQRQVTDLASLLGWQWAHWRPAMTKHGWRTPVSGPLGAGMVDVLLVHPRRQATLWVELKTDRGQLSPEQRAVHEILRTAGLDVRVWRPRDWPEVAATLATPAAAIPEPAEDARDVRRHAPGRPPPPAIRPSSAGTSVREEVAE